MSIWKTKSVSQQPEVTLVHWSVMETERHERHFVGYCKENQEGRVSSRIESFDVKAMRGITQSGRVYQLSGPPGYAPDAEHVWFMWARLNRVKTARNVSCELIQQKRRDGGRTKRQTKGK